MTKRSDELFSSPFCRRYWYLAAQECRDLHMIVLAAVITALRIAIKFARIPFPVVPNLNLTFGFIVNAVGSMIYGPVMAIIASAISDTVGAVIAPSGPYFFPFIFVEILGGVLFALFYYRAKLSPARIIAGRFAVTLGCNLILSPAIMYWQNVYLMGKSYNFLSLPRVIKNWALFPLQSLILIIIIGAVLPVTNRYGLTFTGETKLRVGKKEWIMIAVMLLASALFILGYYWYKGVF